MTDLVLTGLDGSNPLGFLAALGVLEVVEDHDPGARLHFRDEGAWRPVVTGTAASLAEVIGWIDADRESCRSDPALLLEYGGKQDLKPPPGVFRSYLEELVAGAGPAERRSVDWAAAFATDVAVDNNGNTKPTALHFTAGQQLFLKMVRDLVEETTAEDIREALVGPWRYQRPLPVMGWDATSSRDYALRASNPSTDKKLGVPGADWLAIRGAANLPAFPIKDRVYTTGCVGGWKTGRFRWALWTVPLSRPVVRSLVLLDLEGMAPPERAARGVGVVFSCGIKRSDQGGYGSFEPAAVV